MNTASRFLLFVLLLFLSSCSKKNAVIIQGTIENCPPNKMIYLEKLDGDTSFCLDSAKIKKNGQVKFKIRKPSHGFYMIKTNDAHAIMLLVKPGERISFTTTCDNFFEYTLSGSEESQLIKILEDSMRVSKVKLDSLTDVFRQNVTDSMFVLLNKEFSSIIAQRKQQSILFINQHANSLVSLYALYQQLDAGSFLFNNIEDMKYFKMVCDSLMKYHPDSKYVKMLNADYARQIEEYNQIKSMQEQADSVYVD